MNKKIELTLSEMPQYTQVTLAPPAQPNTRNDKWMVVDPCDTPLVIHNTSTGQDAVLEVDDVSGFATDAQGNTILVLRLGDDSC
jgi:hypothetical protein